MTVPVHELVHAGSYFAVVYCHLGRAINLDDKATVMRPGVHTTCNVCGFKLYVTRCGELVWSADAVTN